MTRRFQHDFEEDMYLRRHAEDWERAEAEARDADERSRQPISRSNPTCDPYVHPWQSSDRDPGGYWYDDAAMRGER